MWPTDQTGKYWTSVPLKGKNGRPLLDQNDKPVTRSYLMSPRFIGVAGASAISHGVDVSKWQTGGKNQWESAIDFKRLKHDCGASFAIIRISQVTAGDKPQFNRDPAATGLWMKAAMNDLRVGPYHFFRLKFTKVADDLLEPRGPSFGPPTLIEEIKKSAEGYATEFIVALLDVVKNANQIGIDKVMPIALDVEQPWADWAPMVKLLSAPKPGVERETMRRVRGLYQVGICAWMNTIWAKGIPKDAVVLYTNPGSYSDYDLGVYGKEEVGCDVSRLPLWVAWYRNQGQPHYVPRQPGESDATATIVQRMCLVSPTSVMNPGNCRLHQYSEGGQVGFVKPRPGSYIDLNRLHLRGDSVDSHTWSLRSTGLVAGRIPVGTVEIK
jgi:hypothetical protein